MPPHVSERVSDGTTPAYEQVVNVHGEAPAEPGQGRKGDVDLRGLDPLGNARGHPTLVSRLLLTPGALLAQHHVGGQAEPEVRGMRGCGTAVLVGDAVASREEPVVASTTCEPRHSRRTLALPSASFFRAANRRAIVRAENRVCLQRVSYFVQTRPCLATVWMCAAALGLLLGTAVVGGCHQGRAQVSAGRDHTCALRPNGTIVCWGDNHDGQSTPPAGKFTQVSSGQSYTCGVRTDESVACWGKNDSGQSTPPAGKFTQVSAGLSHACGVKTDGTVACWGGNSFGEGTAPSGTLIQISAGNFHTCGLHPDGSVVCWGANALGQSTAPAGSFSQVSAGSVHTCGIKTDGAVSCWGELEGEDVKEMGIPARLENGPKTAPDSHTAEKSAEKAAKNARILAALKPAAPTGPTPVGNGAPSGTFSQVSAGANHSCGVKVGGSVVCWSNNSSGESTVPAGAFTQVSAGFSHTCGVKTDGTVACWGSNKNGESAPPAGTR